MATSTQLAPELTGRDLDAAVAERVMGWHREVVSDPRFDMSSFENWIDGNGVGIVTPREWNPSTEIAAAMQIVQKFKMRNIFLQLSNFSDCWTASFATETEGGRNNKMLSCENGASAAESICRAALNAVETQ